LRDQSLYNVYVCMNVHVYIVLKIINEEKKNKTNVYFLIYSFYFFLFIIVNDDDVVVITVYSILFAFLFIFF